MDIRECDQTFENGNYLMTDINFLMGAVRQGSFAGQMRPSGAKTSGVSDESNQQARQACAEFEALFINMMLKELRATVNKSGFMDGGKAEELYTGLMDTQISRDLADQGGIGLAEMLSRQMAEKNEARQPAPDDKPVTGAPKNGQAQLPKK